MADKHIVVAAHGHCFDGLVSAALFSHLRATLDTRSYRFSYRSCGYGPNMQTVPGGRYWNNFSSGLLRRSSPVIQTRSRSVGSSNQRPSTTTWSRSPSIRCGRLHLLQTVCGKPSRGRSNLIGTAFFVPQAFRIEKTRWLWWELGVVGLERQFLSEINAQMNQYSLLQRGP